MSYSALSFTASEVPTLTKWNQLWANDAAMADGTGIANGAIINRHLGTASVKSSNIDFTTFFYSYGNVATTWDSGWINVTLQNSYLAQNGYLVQYRKIGNMVYLRGQPGKATLDGNIIFTLPVGCRPTQLSIFNVPGSSTNIGKFVINTDGTCNIGGIPAGGAYVGIDVVRFMADA